LFVRDINGIKVQIVTGLYGVADKFSRSLDSLRTGTLRRSKVHTFVVFEEASTIPDVKVELNHANLPSNLKGPFRPGCYALCRAPSIKEPTDDSSTAQLRRHVRPKGVDFDRDQEARRRFMEGAE
jgi:hypothetical protein